MRISSMKSLNTEICLPRSLTSGASSVTFLSLCHLRQQPQQALPILLSWSMRRKQNVLTWSVRSWIGFELTDIENLRTDTFLDPFKSLKEASGDGLVEGHAFYFFNAAIPSSQLWFPRCLLHTGFLLGITLILGDLAGSPGLLWETTSAPQETSMFPAKAPQAVHAAVLIQSYSLVQFQLTLEFQGQKVESGCTHQRSLSWALTLA